jgi:hypothetical protein
VSGNVRPAEGGLLSAFRDTPTNTLTPSLTRPATREPRPGLPRGPEFPDKL